MGLLFHGAGAATSMHGAQIAAQGDLMAGRAASQADIFNAGVAATNATIAEQNASIASQGGNEQVGISGAKTRADVASIKASQANSGVDVNSGSAVNVRSSAAATGMLDALTIRANAAKAAYGYQTEAAGFKAQSALDKSQAKYDTTAANLRAKGTILGGQTQAASGFGNYLLQNSTFSGLGGGSTNDITIPAGS